MSIDMRHVKNSLEPSHIYYVLWDSEIQTELWRGSEEEFIKEVTSGNFGRFGDGECCVYPCMSGWSISSTWASGIEHNSDAIRDNTELQVLFIEDEQPPFEVNEPVGFESIEPSGRS
jgi:hypothetical protein